MEPTKMLEPIVDRLQTRANVKTVFGDPIESHGKTIIPVARVAYGFGGGMDNHEPGKGGGMGGGVRTTPVGVIEITAEGTRFIRFGHNWKLVGAAALLLHLGVRMAVRALRK